MKTTKNISREEWNMLRYPVALRELSKEEGGGWLAWIPILGRGAFMMDGETAAAAIEKLERHRKDMYEDVVSSGRPIPIPPEDWEESSEASGRWLMRTTKYLHHSLQRAAELQGVSFNQYCIECLIRGDAIIRGVQEKPRYEPPKQRPAVVRETPAKRKKKS